MASERLRRWYDASNRVVREFLENYWTPETLYVKQYSDPNVPPGNAAILFDTAKNRLVLRGVNLPILDDWNFPQQRSAYSYFAEVEKTRANAVRIQWYKDYDKANNTAGRPAYQSELANVLTACVQNHMIPVLMLMDLTARDGDRHDLGALVDWWTSNATVLNAFKKYLVVNIANEFGHYRWRNSDPAALNEYREAYKYAISAIRAVGLNMPLMIDAPDGGTSVHVFLEPTANGVPAGRELINHDPRRNILLSVHAYWAALPYNGIDVAKQAKQSGLPIVFGEVANKQDEQSDYGYYDLDGSNERHPPAPFPDGTVFNYKSLLLDLAFNETGWFAWAWHKDNCTARQITTGGTFATLTPFGTDIVHHQLYGLANDNPYFRTRRSITL